MPKSVRVPIHRTSPTQTVQVEVGATVGAQIGVNLLMPDGSLATTAKLQALFGDGTPSDGSINTTDDLEEGQWNLWFTDRRAQDAVGGILADTATIDLAYTAGTSITATLKDLADSGTGALLAITRDGKGRVTGTKAATITGTAGNIMVTNGDASAGLPAIDLANVTVTAGGTLKKRAFDAKGRLSQESAATTDDLSEGASNLYFTSARVRATTLTGLSTETATAVTAADSVLVGIGKLQGQATANATAISGKLSKSGDLATGDYLFGPNVLKIDSTNSYVGIGTTTPNRKLHIVGIDGSVPIFPTGVGLRNFLVIENNGNANIAFVANGDCGFFAYTSGGSVLDGSFQYNTTSKIASFYTNGSLKLSISSEGNTAPGVDNGQTLGSAALRWSTVYAGTGTINTSDSREKTPVNPLTDAEIAAAAEMARSIGTYQWLASVSEKGDSARHHAGLTVQQAIAIMQSHGLDPFRYGFVCYDQWDELPEVVSSWPAQDAVLDDAGNVITPAIEAGSEVTQAYRPAGDRYSFRHDELLLFIARGFAARLDALETAR